MHHDTAFLIDIDLWTRLAFRLVTVLVHYNYSPIFLVLLNVMWTGKLVIILKCQLHYTIFMNVSSY